MRYMKEDLGTPGKRKKNSTIYDQSSKNIALLSGSSLRLCFDRFKPVLVSPCVVVSLYGIFHNFGCFFFPDSILKPFLSHFEVRK